MNREVQHRFALVVAAMLLVLAGPAHRAAAGACSAIPTFADALTPTSHVYVATTGSNSIGDGSAASPYATIAFAVAHAKPGAAVVIHSGTYAGGTYLNDVAGTAIAPIWIGGAPGEAKPIIQGGGEGLHLTRCKYLIVHDLEVRNVSANGINADDVGDVSDPLASHHLVFRDLSIHDIGGTGNQDGLKLSGINDFVVLDCDLARTGGAGSGSGIDMVGCHNGVIARCDISEGSGSGVQAKGGSENVEIRWCRFTNAGLRAVNIGGSTGFAFFRPPLSTTSQNAEARNIRVLGNVFIGGDSPIAFVGCVNSVVAQNTIVNPTRWLLRILQETVTSPPYSFAACGNNTFESNLLYFSRAALSTHINVGGNTAPAIFTFARNLWYAHDNPTQSTPPLPVVETAGVYGVNPLLTAPGTGDFHLQFDSPAAHVGGPRRAPGDADGRCWCETPAIGAYEWPRTPGDINCDGAVNVSDLLGIIGGWGPCVAAPASCPADVDDDGTVSVTDLLAVIANWG